MPEDFDLFNGDDDKSSVNEIDPNKDYLSELVGEGKKFRDEKELARAKAQSDTFITKLQEENNLMRQTLEEFESELKTRKTVEDNIKSFMDKVKTPDTHNTHTPERTPNQSEQDGDDGRTTEFNGLTKEQVLDLLETRDRARSVQDNFKRAVDEVKQKLGSDWQRRVEQRADELSLGKEFVNELAKTKPDAFIKLMTEGQTQPKEDMNMFTSGNVASPTSGVPNVKGPMTWTQLENLRRTSPSEYFKPKYQNYIYEQTLKYGDEFKQT